MLHIQSEIPMPLPLVWSSNMSDPETPGETGDPEPPGGGKIKPPTNREGIKPPTHSDTESDPPVGTGGDSVKDSSGIGE